MVLFAGVVLLTILLICSLRLIKKTESISCMVIYGIVTVLMMLSVTAYLIMYST